MFESGRVRASIEREKNPGVEHGRVRARNPSQTTDGDRPCANFLVRAPPCLENATLARIAVFAGAAAVEGSVAVQQVERAAAAVDRV